MIGTGLLFALACRDEPSRPEDEDDPVAECHAGLPAFAEAEQIGFEGALVAVADWEGDGDLDVFAGSWETPLSVYEQRHGGSWSPIQVILEDDPDVYPSIELLGVPDLDDDGDADVLIAARSWTEPYPENLTIQWYEHRGDGSLAEPQTSLSSIACSGFTLVDLDRDGEQDVLCTSPLTGTLHWLRHLGGGHFAPPHDLGTWGLLPVDVDDDGDLDLLSRWGWDENTGSTTFDVGHTLRVDGWPYGWSTDPFVGPLATGDPDGDGDTDVVGVVYHGYYYEDPLQYLGWWQNTGGGVFAPLRALGESPATFTYANGWSFLGLVDFDDDGDDDVLYADPGVRWSLLEALGNGVVLESRVVAGSGEERTTLKVADIDADGHADVVAGSNGLSVDPATSSGLSWYRSQLPRGPDADADGTCDQDDLCPGFHDGADTDGDGIPNGCDACKSSIDTDGDGRSDDCDTCPGTRDDIDGDLDGVADVCDRCPTDPLDDTDGDGVCDSEDVCVGIDLVGDTDADGLCNDRDNCAGDNATGDADLDHVCDGDDACLGFPDIIDVDQDGVPDGCDDVVSSTY